MSEKERSGKPQTTHSGGRVSGISSWSRLALLALGIVFSLFSTIRIFAFDLGSLFDGWSIGGNPFSRPCAKSIGARVDSILTNNPLIGRSTCEVREGSIRYGRMY